MQQMAVEITELSKRFGPTIALEDVSFDIIAGQVHALVGENGAGKSTLIKVLSGVHQQDTGTVRLYGKPYTPHNPTDAQKSGVSTMFQESQRVSNLSVAENLFLGNEPKKGPLLDWPQLFKDAAALLDRLSIPVDARQPMENLTTSEGKLIEMAHAVHRKAKVLIMDEPTANLNQAEQQILFNVLRNLNENEGVTFIYISHHLQEVFELCHRVTVLRDGGHISTMNVSETTPDRLVESMIGRQMQSFYPLIAPSSENVRLKVDGLRLPQSAVRNVSFEVKGGEIYGVYGLADSGRTALVNALFGLAHHFEGKVTLDGVAHRPTSPKSAIQAGVILVPEDRKLQGLMLNLDLLHNLSASNFSKFSGAAALFDSSQAKTSAVATIQRLKVKPPDYNARAGGLSGGNQQKIVIGKWLNRTFKLAIFQEPTRGIDVGAKMQVYTVIKELNEAGVAIILISSEIMELMGMCHRIGVLSGGVMTQEFAREDFT
jgi:ABC-type sugar transport system ATPase subunit